MTPLIEKMIAQLQNQIETALYYATDEETERIEKIRAAMEEAARPAIKENVAVACAQEIEKRDLACFMSFIGATPRQVVYA